MDNKKIVVIGKTKNKKPSFKITLTQDKDGAQKMEFEGSNPIATALLFGGLQVAKKVSQEIGQIIDDIRKKKIEPSK